MAIRGSLRDASLADVLQLLALGHKSGCLSVTHEERFGYIYFEKGRISDASVVNRRERVGEALVKDGVLPPDALARARVRQHEVGGRLLDVLLADDAVPRATLQRYARQQVEEAVFYLLTWTQGTFNFEVDVRPEHPPLAGAISPDALLLEGARRIDEWSLIEKKISSPDLVFDLDRPRIMEHAPTLTPEQIALAGLIDGRRDVAGLGDASGLSEFEVGKALYGLLTAGFLHRVGRSRAGDGLTRATRAAEHRNLGVAFYRAGMLADAIREFRRVLDLAPGDEQALFHLGLAHTRQHRWDDAIAAFRRGAERPDAPASVFHNLAVALECAGRFAEARATLEPAARLGGAAAPYVRLSAGVLAMRAGELQAATAALLQAGDGWAARERPAAWYHFSALAAALGGDLDRAIATLTDGVQQYPRSGVLLNNLAAALERRGRHADAFAAAERGASEEPEIPQLHKNLGDHHYRAGRYDDAYTAYARAVTHEPTLGADAYVKLGNIAYRRQDPAEAARCWERALELAPANATARANLEAVRQLS